MALMSGQGGHVKVGAVTKTVLRWSATPSSSYDESTNTGSGGFYEDVACIKALTGSIDIKNDTAALPSSIGLVQGATVALKLYHAASGKYIDVPTAHIDAIAMTNDAKLVNTATIAWHSSGSYTIPV